MFRILIIVLLFLLTKILSGKWGFPDWLLLSSVALLVVAIIFILFFLNKKVREQMQLFGSAFIFILVYLIFSAFNFYTDRYLACLVPFYFFLIIGCLALWLSERQVIISITGSALAASSIYILLTYDGYGDISPRNYEAVTVQKEVADFLKVGKRQNNKILTSFIMANNLSNPLAGFVDEKEKFTKLITPCADTSGINYITVFSFDQDSCRRTLIEHQGFVPEKVFAHGKATGTVYFRPGS